MQSTDKCGDSRTNHVLEQTTAAVSGKLKYLRPYAKRERTSGNKYNDSKVLAALHETALGLMQRRELDDVLSIIASRVSELMKTEHVFIYMLDADGSHFERKLALGVYAEDQDRKVKVGEGLVGEVHRTSQPFIIDDYSKWENRIKAPFFDKIRGVIHVPLRTAKEVVGSFGVALTDPERKFSPQDVRLLTRFAELAAVALDNAYLYSQMQRELTERVQAEEKLRKAEEDQRALLDAIPDLMFTLSRNGVFLDYRTKSTEELYVSPETFLGKSVREIMPPMVAEEIMRCIEKAFKTGKVQTCAYQLPILGEALYFEARIVINGRGQALAIVRDMTHSKHIEQQLEYLSLRDPLTGLYNRDYFEEELARLEQRDDIVRGVFICDVDGLKLVNDTVGHGVGDKVLRAAASILRSCFHGGEIVARIGGDEFAVLLGNCTENKLTEASHRVKAAIEKYNADNPQVPLSMSAGFACGMAVKAVDLFKEADNNMYREKLHRRQSTRSAIVQTLTQALEARDFITEGHADRMQDMAAEFASNIGLSERNIGDLRLLAQFHDIGKVGIPDSILFKTDRLNSEEWEIMKRHCEIGYRIAKSSPDLDPIADWILKHQEWWNGGGYPLGIKGQDIPVECRILSIIDAFDAMTNDRPYRKAMKISDAIAELERCAGKQFDPELVPVFVKLIQGK